jgi:hypothetical protein
MHRRRKLHIRRHHQQQLVTGLVVNERVNLPRRRRRQLRAVLHRLKTGQAATMSPSQLQGWESFASMVRTQSERLVKERDGIRDAGTPR